MEKETYYKPRYKVCAVEDKNGKKFECKIFEHENDFQSEGILACSFCNMPYIGEHWCSDYYGKRKEANSQP